MTNSFIQLSDVTLQYGGGTVALDHTSLGIDKGDFVALVGPSGCGKSTILKLVAGLLKPSSGAVIADGREVGAVASRGPGDSSSSGAPRLRVGLAFQNPTMLPWLTIRDNVMIPLKIVQPFRQDYRRKRHGEYTDRVEALLAQVGLRGFGDKRPWQLSGGMLQRASLCRALIHDPELLLLDEPFGALDQFTREELWDIMQSLWMTKKPTVLLVTHDLRESAYLANRICVMSSRPGRIIDVRDVPFDRPRTLEGSYSAEFAGLVQQLRMRIAAARRDGDALDLAQAQAVPA
jgi:NitT/TauT family transport system ATP-binding protein